jgi:hypothetical protein
MDGSFAVILGFINRDHSITSSAMAMSVGGTSVSSSLAVCRFDDELELA